MPFQIIRGNIVDMNVDAIVNAANYSLQRGGGVCGAIFEAAGTEALQTACNAIGRCPTGRAVLTPGFALKAKYVIHAVGPVWQGGYRGEESLLRSAYTSALELAAEHSLRSVAFPLISSGIYGYPKDQALQIALSAIQDFLMHADDIDVTLVVFDRAAFALSEKLFTRVNSYIDEHYVSAKLRSERNRPLPSSLFNRRDHESEDFAQSEAAGFSDDLYECVEQAADEASEHDVYRASEPLPDMPPHPMAVPHEQTSGALDRLKSLLARRSVETFSEMVLRLVDEKGFKKDSIVYKRANLDRSVFSKLRSNRSYTPSKSTAVALSLALELNMDQTRDLLARAGYALSPSDLGDVIVSYFIENSMFDIFEINAVLFSYDQPMLGVRA